MAVVQSEGSLIASHRSFARYPQSLSFYSGYSEDYAAIYRTQPSVRTVIEFLAMNFAQVKLKTYRRISDTDRQDLNNHPLAQSIRNPNPWSSRHRFFRDMFSDYLLYSNAFSLKVRADSFSAVQQVRIPPFLIQPYEDPQDTNWYRVKQWQVGNRERVLFDADKIIHLAGYNPDDSRVGLSPMETLRRILAEDKSSGEWREQFWKNSARQSGYIKRPKSAPKWSEEAEARFKTEWRALYTGVGPDAGGTPILEDDMEYVNAGFSPKDSEYLGARKLTREEIASAFHLSPVFVGILDNANYSNVKEMHKGLYQDALGPHFDFWEEEYELQLMSEFADVENVYLEFNIREKLKGSFEEEAAVLQTATGAPWLLRNEARARQNLPAVEGGDQLVVPLNVLVGGQASATDSAPPIGAASRTMKAIEAPKKKSADDLESQAKAWHAKHVEVLSAYFASQKSSIMSRLGSGQSLSSAWVDSTWDNRLKGDLQALTHSMVDDMGTKTASDLGGEFDIGMVENYIAETCDRAAKAINATTKAQLANAEDNLKAIGRKDTADFLERADEIFVVAEGTRSDQIAVSRVTSLGSFAKEKAGEQTGAGTKTWVVHSNNSRHPSLSGETVEIGKTFSNGALWPGHGVLALSQRAGCTCELQINP